MTVPEPGTTTGPWPPTRPDPIAVAMSGGVDSSVAALLLAEAGYPVFGVTLKLWCYGDAPAAERACCSLSAIEDARRVCDHLGIRNTLIPRWGTERVES